MKNRKWFWALLFFATTLTFDACGDKGGGGDEPPPPEPPPANDIPYLGAEGAGKYVTGGRGGTVYAVTSLDDAIRQAGTLRWALEQPSPKIIVFKVSGTIKLLSKLTINKGNVTIAGQTAPGNGITIRDYPVFINANNVIIQFVRFRMGDAKGASVQDDALGGQNSNTVLIDHCTMSWSTDECGSFYDNDNFTLQWCILSESLRNSVHDKGQHGYGGIWGGHNATFHHNLLAHHDSRNPRFNGDRFTGILNNEKVDFRNNVIYNWGQNSAYAGEGGVYNLVNNYYKPGDATKSGVKARVFAPDSDPSNGGSSSKLSDVLGGVNKPWWGKFYVSGNYMYGKGENWDWNGVEPNVNSFRDGSLTVAQVKEMVKLTAEVDVSSINTQSAQEAFNSVLEYAGASFVRDAIDNRIVNETRTGTYTYTGSKGSTGGLIDSQTDVQISSNDDDGWLTPGVVQAQRPDSGWDSDGDGIPNDWEDAHGLDKNNRDDGKAKTLNPPYTNLEVYLHDLVKHLYPQ